MNKAGEVKKVTEADYDFALGALPPVRMSAGVDYELFALGEAYSGNLHHWYVYLNGSFWSLLGCVSMTDAQILECVRPVAVAA